MESETAIETQEKSYEVDEVIQKETYGTDWNYKHKYIWPHVVVHAMLQIAWLIGFYMLIFHTKYPTILWGVFIGFLAAEGVGLGAHRGYTHKSYKASFPLKVALMVFQTMAGQNSMLTWTRDHILHHKYSDTDADPHNSNRGFFFAHMGWLMMKKHPLLRQKQREMDISDLLQDKLLMFQHDYFVYLYIPLAVVIPVAVPVYFWNESFWTSFFVVYCFQYVTNLHITWSINSFAHFFGSKPYDTRIRATESAVSSFLTMGEGWHNFHHAFPWDYRMGEKFSLSASVLYLLACLGLAYDLKVASPSIVQGHMKRHGGKIGRETLSVEEVIEFKRQPKDTSETVLDGKTKVA